MFNVDVCVFNMYCFWKVFWGLEVNWSKVKVSQYASVSMSICTMTMQPWHVTRTASIPSYSRLPIPWEGCAIIASIYRRGRSPAQVGVLTRSADPRSSIEDSFSIQSCNAYGSSLLVGGGCSVCRQLCNGTVEFGQVGGGKVLLEQGVVDGDWCSPFHA